MSDLGSPITHVGSGLFTAILINKHLHTGRKYEKADIVVTFLTAVVVSVVQIAQMRKKIKKAYAVL